MQEIPTITDIRQAALRIDSFTHKTPLISNKSINEIFNSEIFFKCENFQKVGAFKFRGALNAVLSLSNEQAKNGVATHSSGNHAAALAKAAQIRNIPSYIVMPENAPQVKKQAVAGYGAEITFCKPTLKAREEYLEKVIKQTGATFIHPYNDRRVIAGQGTAALEIIFEQPNLDYMLTPIGGGGLTSGTAIAVKTLSGKTKMIAAEPARADDAYRSFISGILLPSENPDTIADGLLTSLGDLTFTIVQKHVDQIIIVQETSIIKAMRLIWERLKIIIEPSSAVPLAVLLEKQLEIEGKRVGIILSGGNVDLDALPWNNSPECKRTK